MCPVCPEYRLSVQHELLDVERVSVPTSTESQQHEFIVEHDLPKLAKVACLLPKHDKLAKVVKAMTRQ